jgi:hypothetical protein
MSMGSENWPPMRHGSRCGCRCCRSDRRSIDWLTSESLSTALRHAQNRYEQELEDEVEDALESGYENDFEDDFDAFDTWEASRKSKTKLPGLDVAWSKAATLKDLAAKKAAAPPSAGAFHDKGKMRVYRIYKKGSRKPLYVGMVHGSDQSVAQRIQDHLSGKKVGQAKSETKQLADALKAVKDQSEMLIRYGEITPPKGFRDGAKFVHGVEMLLQSMLQPQIYNPGSLTFEEVEEGFI